MYQFVGFDAAPIAAASAFMAAATLADAFASQHGGEVISVTRRKDCFRIKFSRNGDPVTFDVSIIKV